jgi:hypothetical protein
MLRKPADFCVVSSHGWCLVAIRSQLRLWWHCWLSASCSCRRCRRKRQKCVHRYRHHVVVVVVVFCHHKILLTSLSNNTGGVQHTIDAIPVCGLQDDFTVIKFFKYLRFPFINDAFFGTAVALIRLFYRPADQFSNY